MSTHLPRTKKPSKLKTYSHLASARRMPTDYEVKSSALLWYPPRGGFEVNVPLGEWYSVNQRGSPIQCDNWDAFADPRETTYSKYVALEQVREANAESVVRLIDERRYDDRLPAEWVNRLEMLLPVAKFPVHAMQMIAAYVGQMAPGGRIVIACALQAADEVRRIQRLTQRTVQLRQTRAAFGAQARRLWEKEAGWQPMRELLERALTTWDWCEALVVLGLCVGPLFDGFLMTRIPEIAGRRGDPMLAPLFSSLEEDCSWHRDWTKAFFSMVLAARGENRQVIESWLEKWLPRTEAAIHALDTFVSPDAVASVTMAAHREWLASLGVVVP